jgi:hypothetical protein
MSRRDNTQGISPRTLFTDEIDMARHSELTVPWSYEGTRTHPRMDRTLSLSRVLSRHEEHLLTNTLQLVIPPPIMSSLIQLTEINKTDNYSH